MISYNTLSGSSIDQIYANRIAYRGDILSDDIFVASQQILSNVNPNRTYESNGELYRNEYRSVKTSYHQLSDQLFNDLCSQYGIKNMAHESSAEYSLINHIHNYSSCYISATMSPKSLGYDPKKSDEEQPIISNIVTFVVDGKNITMSMPQIKLFKQPEAYIGQLRFLAVPTLDTINVSALDFDGWVYPDGREIPSAIFPDAWNTFGTTYGSNSAYGTFKLPDFRQFFKPAPYTNTGSFETNVAGTNGIVVHTHEVSDVSLSGKLCIDLSLLLTDSNSGSCAMHDSNGDSSYFDSYLKFEMKGINLRDDTIDISYSSPNLDVQTHPTYNMMPVLMYIGKRQYVQGN